MDCQDKVSDALDSAIALVPVQYLLQQYATGHVVFDVISSEHVGQAKRNVLWRFLHCLRQPMRYL